LRASLTRYVAARGINFDAQEDRGASLNHQVLDFTVLYKPEVSLLVLTPTISKSLAVAII